MPGRYLKRGVSQNRTVFHNRNRLWQKLEEQHGGEEPSRVAGVDVSYRDEHFVAALVIFEEGKLQDTKVNTGVYRMSLIEAHCFF